MTIAWTDEDTAKLERLQVIGESITADARQHNGRIGVRCLMSIIMKSERAGEVAEFLPWALNRVLRMGPSGADPSETDMPRQRELIVRTAVGCPAVHHALMLCLPDFLEGYCAKHGLGLLARSIATSKNPDLINIVRPYFPASISRAVRSSHAFGNIACDWLDIGERMRC